MVVVGVCLCVFARALNTPVHTDRVHVNMSSINMYVGAVQGVWKVVLMLWVGKEGTDSFLP